MSNPQQNIVEVIGDLDAGVFAQKMETALHQVAEGVIHTGKKGKVTITFDIEQIASSHQVKVRHKLSYLKPTDKGKVSEENTTETPMHVGVRGKLSLYPESQPDLYKQDPARNGATN